MIKTSLNLFFSGFLFASGPCLVSCGPLLVSYIAGNRKDIFQAGIFYSLFSFSRVAVYLVLSLGVYFLGSVAREYLFPGYVSLFGGIFIGLCGLFMIAGKNLKPPFIGWFERFFRPSQIKNPLVFGLIYGLLPCAPFLFLLSYVGLISHSWWEALVYTFCFGLGSYLSPLLVLSVFSGALSNFLKGAREKYLKALSVLCGLIIVFLGIQLIRKGF